MLRSITFGTFYFFLVFCLILIVWVYFCVPETKGLRIEEMDKIFGGRRRLGLIGGEGSDMGSDEKSVDGKGQQGVQVVHHEA